MKTALSRKYFIFLIAIYVFFNQVILPLSSPLRVLGLAEPGEIRNVLLPPLLILLILSMNLRIAFLPRTYLHIALMYAFICAMFIGLDNFLNGNHREYFSHLFQVGSAYILLNVGWMAYGILKDNFWKRLAILALIATLISTALTLLFLGRGEVGRLYTPAYAFIFVSSYSINGSSLVSLLTFIGLLLSNKRGPILSVVIMFFIAFIFKTFLKSKSKAKGVSRGFLKIIGFSIAAIFCLIALVNWSSEPVNSNSPIAIAVNITYGRLNETVNFQDSDRSLDQISAGRFEEIEDAQKSLNGFNYLFGSGAGWSISLEDGKQVQNIHFSPLSISAVFGVPFTLYLYLYLSFISLRGIFIISKKAIHFDLMQKMAPFYLLGALVHSLFAYSLFIDWLVFFFAGVLLKTLKEVRKDT